MRDKLEKYDIQKLESYWIYKNQLKKELKFREQELLEPYLEEDINSTIKGSKTSDLTQNKALLLASDDKYQNIKRIIKSVEDIYSSLDDETKRIVDMRYNSKYNTWEDIAEELYMSKAKVLRIRNKILDLTAEFIGWV